MSNTFLSRLLIGASLVVVSSCGSPEPAPQPAAKDTTQAAPAQVQSLPSGPLDVLKQYNRAMKRGDSSAVNFATGRAATAKSYAFLKTSASGFAITYSDPQVVQDSAIIEFRVTRDNSSSTHTAHLGKVGGEWKVERIENK